MSVHATTLVLLFAKAEESETERDFRRGESESVHCYFSWAESDARGGRDRDFHSLLLLLLLLQTVFSPFSRDRERQKEQRLKNNWGGIAGRPLGHFFHCLSSSPSFFVRQSASAAFPQNNRSNREGEKWKNNGKGKPRKNMTEISYINSAKKVKNVFAFKLKNIYPLIRK